MLRFGEKCKASQMLSHSIMRARHQVR